MCWGAQFSPRNKSLRDALQRTGRTIWKTFDLLTQAVPGSHRAGPETHGGGRGGRPSPPTADGRL